MGTGGVVEVVGGGFWVGRLRFWLGFLWWVWKQSFNHKILTCPFL